MRQGRDDEGIPSMLKKLRALVKPKSNLDTVEEYKEFILGMYADMGGAPEDMPTDEQWKEAHADFLKDWLPEAPGKTW
jgi:hypothetical protein